MLEVEADKLFKLKHETLVKKIGASWLDGLERFGYEIPTINFHLLHRFCCLLATANDEPELSCKLLTPLLRERNAPIVTSVSSRFAKVPVGDFFQFSESVTIGAHTRTSKWWARNRGGLAASALQILPISESTRPYSDVAIPGELIRYLATSLTAELAISPKIILRSSFSSLDRLVRSILERVVLPQPVPAVVNKLEKLELVWVPRPADTLVSQVVGALNAEAKVLRFGHNLAYAAVLRNELSQRYFPVTDRVRPAPISYLDDIRAYRRSNGLRGLLTLKKTASDLILVSCFPYGDTGYNEYYSNDSYQREFLEDFVTALAKSRNRDKVVFCIHPGTTDMGFVEATLRYCRYEVGVFDSLLQKSKLVISPYRGTSCVAAALANQKRITLVGDYEFEELYAHQGATVTSRERIMTDLDRIIEET